MNIALEDIYNARAVSDDESDIETHEDADFMSWLPAQLTGALGEGLKGRVTNAMENMPQAMFRTMLTYIVCNEPLPRELTHYIVNEYCIWHDHVKLDTPEATCLFYYIRIKTRSYRKEEKTFFKYFHVDMFQTIFTTPEEQIHILRTSIETTHSFSLILQAKSIVGRTICMKAIQTLSPNLLADLQNKFFAGKFDDVEQTLGDMLLDSSVILGCVEAINNGYQYNLVSRLFTCVPDRKSMQKVLSKVEHPSYRAMYETSAKKLAENIIESFEAEGMCRDIALLCMSYICNNSSSINEMYLS